jgi:hypothetical protein
MKKVSLPLLTLLLCSCSKDYFKWDLQKTETPKGTLVVSNDCSSLNGINSLYYGLNGTSDNWGISTNGYNGACWSAPDPNNFGNLSLPQGSCYVEFNNYFNHKGYIEFMFMASLNGNGGREPNIYIDNALQSNVNYEASESNSLYSKTITDTIASGNHTIKFEFQGSGEYIKVDNIDIFEYLDSI